MSKNHLVVLIGEWNKSYCEDQEIPTPEVHACSTRAPHLSYSRHPKVADGFATLVRERRPRTVSWIPVSTKQWLTSTAKHISCRIVNHRKLRRASNLARRTCIMPEIYMTVLHTIGVHEWPADALRVNVSLGIASWCHWELRHVLV